MKYIIFDLDATLLNDQAQVTDYTLAVLNKLREMGHRTVINTARSMSYASEYFEILKPDYAIYNGGSHIVNEQRETIFKAAISNQETLEITKELLAVTQNFSVQTEDVLYSHKGLYTGQKSQPFDYEKEVFPYAALKIVAGVEDDAAALEIAQKHDLAMTTYLRGNFRRYNQKGVDKASGNRKLMELTGGTLEDVLAFGDDLGDVGMLQEAGVGVLMNNAFSVLHDQVKLHSAYGNNEDGVARFLAEYFALEDYKM